MTIKQYTTSTSFFVSDCFCCLTETQLLFRVRKQANLNDLNHELGSAERSHPLAPFAGGLLTMSVWKQMCVPVYTQRTVIGKVWFAPQELAAAQWEPC